VNLGAPKTIFWVEIDFFNFEKKYAQCTYFCTFCHFTSNQNIARKMPLCVLCIAGGVTPNAIIIALKYINNKITMCGKVRTRSLSDKFEVSS